MLLSIIFQYRNIFYSGDDKPIPEVMRNQVEGYDASVSHVTDKTPGTFQLESDAPSSACDKPPPAKKVKIQSTVDEKHCEDDVHVKRVGDDDIGQSGEEDITSDSCNSIEPTSGKQRIKETE